MPGLMTEAGIQEGLLPSYEDMEFLPQEDDLYTQVFGHHDLHLEGADEGEWEATY
jgi:hypothetical protein